MNPTRVPKHNKRKQGKWGVWENIQGEEKDELGSLRPHPTPVSKLGPTNKMESFNNSKIRPFFPAKIRPFFLTLKKGAFLTLKKGASTQSSWASMQSPSEAQSPNAPSPPYWLPFRHSETFIIHSVAMSHAHFPAPSKEEVRPIGDSPALAACLEPASRFWGGYQPPRDCPAVISSRRLSFPSCLSKDKSNGKEYFLCRPPIGLL
jgi:hypothetical protein